MRTAIVAVGLAMMTASASAEPRINHSSSYVVKVDSGIERRLTNYWGLNPDCTVRRGFNVRVEREPRHGTVRLEKSEAPVDVGWKSLNASKRSAEAVQNCMGRSVPVIAVFYRSNPGYQGEDDLFLIRTNTGGKSVTHIEYRLRVQ